MAEINLGNLYEFNKEAMKNENPLDPIELNSKTAMVAKDMKYGSEYWMLLCHERRDYTLFNIISVVNHLIIADELKSTLQNRGFILSIDEQPDGAWEIWIRDFETNENFAYYLFQYDEGVIEINE